MLVELRLENYAVIDNVAVEFASGLNLLTGETGAGKSILIDALALLLGEKASTDVIRAGADRAVISAVFQCGEGPSEKPLAETLAANGLDESREPRPKAASRSSAARIHSMIPRGPRPFQVWSRTASTAPVSE